MSSSCKGRKSAKQLFRLAGVHEEGPSSFKMSRGFKHSEIFGISIYKGIWSIHFADCLR